jgi:hypothetical protein
MPANASVYGLTPSAVCCAFRNLAEDTNFIAEVIFSVFRTEFIRPLVSFRVGIRLQA